MPDRHAACERVGMPAHLTDASGRPRSFLIPAALARLTLVDRLSSILMALGLAGIGILVLVWLRMIRSPVPQEMREGAVVWTTLAFLMGENPYALDAVPGAGNVYGPLYPLLVALVAPILGPTLVTHRLVNAVGIAVACGLLFRILRRDGASTCTALAGAGINLAGLLYWVGPTTRPDGVGMALALGAYSVMAPAPADPRRFTLGLLLAMAGFATKIYYVLPPVAALVCLLWIGDLRRLFFRTLAFALTLLATAAALSLLFPTWAPIVIGANLQASTYDTDHLARQTRDWAIFSLPLLVAVVAAGAPSIRRYIRRLTERCGWHPHASATVAPARAASDARSPLPLWSAALALGAAAIIVSLGGHRGAHMTYFFHLISPALTVLALRGLDGQRLPRLAFAASLPVAVIVNAHWFTLDLARFDRAEATFARMAHAIDQARRPTATGEFAPLLLAAGVSPIETGHTEYLRYRRARPMERRLLSSAAPFRAEEDRRRHLFFRAVHTGSFDLVIANRRRLDLLTPDVLWGQYGVAEQIEIDMPWAQQQWPVDVWVPKGRLTAVSPFSATLWKPRSRD